MNRIIKAISLRVNRLYYKVGANSIHGVGLLRRFQNFEIVGMNNFIDVRSKLPKDVSVFIYGNNHRLVIEEEVVFKKGKIWFEDHDCEIHIGAGTTIEEANLAVAENGTKLIIGKDCMFSRGIHIATTDSHSVINAKTGERTNPAQNITIGNHVWLGYCANINKGVYIGDDVVVAGHSVVTKSVYSNTIIAGIPAKVVKENINWDRTRI